MHYLLWRYQVASGAVGEFEREYGPDGSWAALFREADGFMRTELHRDGRTGFWKTTDVWASAEAFARFQAVSADRYRELDEKLGPLTTLEERIGAFTCRPARRSESAQLSELMRRTFVDTYAAQNLPENVEAYTARSYGVAQQTREIEDADMRTVVCETEGAPIAFAQLRRNASPAVSDAQAIELFRFYVDRPWHGQGVAALLMAEVSDAARGMGAHVMWLGVWEKNPRARSFYLRCGFRDAGWQQFTVGADVQNDHVMVSALPIPV